MTKEQALQILAEATQPQNIAKITREGYAQIEQALQVIRKSFEDKAA
jgi:hypothetical protein